MPIEFRCPGCQRRLRVPDGAEGWLAQCPLCGQQTPIPFRWSAERPSSSGEETPYSPTWTDPRWLERPSAPPEPFPPEPSSGMATGDEFFPPPAPTGPFPAEPFPTQMEQTRQGAGSATAGSLTGTWDWHRHYASQRLSTPANWLIALSTIAFGMGLMSLVVVALGMAAQGQPPPQPAQELGHPDRTALLIGMGSGLLLDLVLLWGSIKMKQLQNYPLAMTTALLAIVPCTSPCCVLSIPFGIWALVVLTDPAVKNAFH